MELNPQDFFRVPRRILSIFGIWPVSSKSLPLFFYINWISLICSSSVGLFHSYAHRDDLFMVLDSLTPSITEVVSAIKISMFFYYRKDFGKILNQLFDLYMGERSQTGIRIYRKCDAYAALVVSTLCFFGFVTCTTYIVTPLLYNLYFYFTNQALVRELPFKAVYPFLDAYSDSNYVWCYIHLSHGGLCTATAFVGMDGLFINACNHISGQFQIIGTDVENLTAEIRGIHAKSSRSLVFNEHKNQELRRQLIQLIRRQIAVMDITDRLVDVYTIIIFAHFLSAAIIICFASINILLGHGAVQVLYVNYIAAVMVQLYTYAHSGTIIAENSGQIAIATYCMEWHHSNQTVKRIIWMMITRSQHAVVIRVPFFTVSLEAYTKIMSTAGSYIAVLNSMLQK